MLKKFIQVIILIKIYYLLNVTTKFLLDIIPMNLMSYLKSQLLNKLMFHLN